jgi:hypothetical protein
MGSQGQDSGGGLLGAAMSMGQVSMRVYPIKDIVAFEFKPLKGMTVGHFQVLTPATSENCGMSSTGASAVSQDID